MRPPLVVAALTTAFTLVTVHAATLGGLTSRSLLALDKPASSGAPAVIGCDNFTGTTGATLAGRVTQVPAKCSSRIWSVHVGTWTVQSNRGASSTTANAHATLDTSSVDCTVQAVVTSVNSGGRSGGIVGSHDGVDTYLAAVLVDSTPDRAELRLRDGTTTTVLASATLTLTTTNELRLRRSGTSVQVWFNGAAVISHTLSAGSVTTLGTGSRAGLAGAHTSVRFDDLVVTVP